MDITSNTINVTTGGTVTSGFMAPAPTKWKFCANCGQQLQPGWNHCPGCGTAVGNLCGCAWPWVITYPYPYYPWNTWQAPTIDCHAGTTVTWTGTVTGNSAAGPAN